MTRRRVVVGSFFALVMSASSCAMAAAVPPVDSDLVVWQGEAKLTLSDIDGRLSKVPADKRAGFMNDPDRIEQMLRNLLLARLLAREAEVEKLDQDPVVAAEIAQARDEILARRRLSLHLRDVNVPDFDVLSRERFVSSPELYSSTEMLDVRHILISSDKHGDVAAKALATKVRDELVGGKGDFVAAVTKYSEDEGTKTKGGLIEGLTRGDTLADFEAAAFDLKAPGDISEPVHTKFGYHVIKLEKRIPSKRFTYDEVKSQIVDELKLEFIGRAQQDYLAQRRSTALDANADLVQSLRSRYLPGAPGTLAIERTQPSNAPLAPESLGGSPPLQE